MFGKAGAKTGGLDKYTLILSKAFWQSSSHSTVTLFLSFLNMVSHTMVNLEINLLMYWILPKNPLICLPRNYNIRNPVRIINYFYKTCIKCLMTSYLVFRDMSGFILCIFYLTGFIPWIRELYVGDFIINVWHVLLGPCEYVVIFN